MKGCRNICGDSLRVMRVSGMETDHVRHDPVGFPMVWVPDIRAFVHCLPVTKIQFEQFLCDARDGHFNAPWYDEALRLNPRTTARRIVAGNYWNAFLTGILPFEAERFAAWCGEGYRLLEEGEWQSFFGTMKLWNIRSLADLGILSGLGPRQRELIESIEKSVEEVCTASGEKCDLEVRMLLRLGVMEWVSIRGREDHRWGGVGEPHPTFCGNLFSPEKGELILLREPESRRLPSFGFRLAFDPSVARDAKPGTVGA